MKRNLLFHLYAKKQTMWPWHVEKLIQYSKAWNGRRIAIVVMDDWTEDEETIRRALAPLGMEVLIRRNDPEFGETKHFIETLGLLKSLDPQEATFYCHSKGVSRDGPLIPAITMWCRAMYALCLDRPELIEKLLQTAQAAGAFRVRIPHSGSTWCYAGTFFWLKHSTLFSKEKWTEIAGGKWGVEGYPGLHLKFDDTVAMNRDVVEPRWLPDWLYGRNGSGVTEGHLKVWMDELWRMG